MLLGKEGHKRFEPAARRFLERFIREDAPTVEQVKKVADALNSINGYLELIAWGALMDLAEQLERRRRAPTKKAPLDWQ